MEHDRFSRLVGNAVAKERLAVFADTGEFPHALLLEGPRGSGKRTFAALLAQAAVCTAEQGRPCGECVACRKAERGIHPDIAVYGGQGGARSFHIDVVRAFREDAYILPNEAKWRVIVLPYAENMTEQAQNALLRILEEPPRHILFVLTCENRALLLPTILSRVQTVSLFGVTAEEALPVLREFVPAAEEGTLREALSVFDGCIGQVAEAMSGDVFPHVIASTEAIGEALLSPTELPLLKATAPLDRDAELTDGTLAGLCLLLRDALAKKQGRTESLSTAPKTADKLARMFSDVRLMRAWEAVQDLQKARRSNMSSALLITLLCARLTEALRGEAVN